MGKTANDWSADDLYGAGLDHEALEAEQTKEWSLTQVVGWQFILGGGCFPEVNGAIKHAHKTFSAFEKDLNDLLERYPQVGFGRHYLTDVGDGDLSIRLGSGRSYLSLDEFVVEEF